MHRRKRTVAFFVWPIVAATGIIVLLLLQWTQLASPKGPTIAVAHSIVSTRAVPSPRTLPVTAPSFSGIDQMDAARLSAAAHSGRIDHEANYPSLLPAAPSAAVSLHAPLLETNDELAGLESREPPTQSFSAASTRTNSLEELGPEEDSDAQIPATLAIQRSSIGNQSRAWPETPVLIAMLSEPALQTHAGNWSAEVQQQLLKLQNLQTLGDSAAGPILQRLSTLAAEGLAAAESLGDRPAQVECLRGAHAIQRRLAVWIPVWETTRNAPTQFVAASHSLSIQTDEIERRANKVAEICDQTGDAEAWKNFLLLERIIDPRQANDPARRRLTAQRLLSRLEWEGLSEEQQSWLEAAEIQDFALAVRPWAEGPVNYRRLLEQIERQEADSIDLAGIDVAATNQALRFGGGDASQQVAHAINTYYRNANLRLSISETMLNRILPAMPDKDVPVSQTIRGTRIGGTSHVASGLRISLLPSPDSWNLQLQTDGHVLANTVGRNGPVTVHNTSNANFAADTDLRITRHGLQIQPSNATVDQQTKLRALNTDYDGFPLIGSLVRGFALSKYEETREETRHLTTSRMERQIADGIDTQLETEIVSKTERLTDQLLGPLARLRLAPTVVDLQTDEDRLSARYRLAGDWQLAAYTPRPRAMSDALLSVQVHQSALNNTFERLAPKNEPQAIRDVATELLQMFGQSTDNLPDDLPSDVRVQFSNTRPVTTEIKDDRLWLTFRIVRLTRDGGLDLRHFIVRACFRGERDGLQARLVRDGSLSIKGARMSMGQRVTVRAIFNKILSENRPLPLTANRLAENPSMAETEISQLELRDGWIAMAITPQRIAYQKAPASQSPSESEGPNWEVSHPQPQHVRPAPVEKQATRVNTARQQRHAPAPVISLQPATNGMDRR